MPDYIGVIGGRARDLVYCKPLVYRHPRQTANPWCTKPSGVPQTPGVQPPPWVRQTLGVPPPPGYRKPLVYAPGVPQTPVYRHPPGTGKPLLYRKPVVYTPLPGVPPPPGVLLLPGQPHPLAYLLPMSAACPTYCMLFGAPYLLRATVQEGVHFVALLWVLYTVVAFCLPTYFPITQDSFNWAPVAIISCLILLSIWWVVDARFWFRGPLKAQQLGGDLDTAEGDHEKESVEVDFSKASLVC